jgi:ABC-2 type transport system permease protein
MKKKLFTVWVFARLNTRRFFRDKLALFFGVAFPLIFLFVFGGLSRGNNDVSFRVALINESHTSVASQVAGDIKKAKVFKLDEKVTTMDQAKEKMTRSQLDATIVLPEGFGETSHGKPQGQAQVVYTQNGEQAGQTLVTVLQGTFKERNSKYVVASEPFTVKGESLHNKSLSRFDYTFAGLLGFSIIGLGIFGPVNVFPELKKQGILRRLHTTPLRVWQYFTSMMISQAIIGLFSLAVMFTVAISVFHLHVVGNWLAIVVWLIVSITMILGIGLAIGGWARNERQAAPLANIVVFPMMFLSGTFFPRYAMPDFLQKITDYLPLSPVIDGIRLIATEGKGLFDIGSQLLIVGVWLVVIYIIAFRVFRWE